MKRNWKEFIIRICILMIGLCIAHLGVTLFLLSNLGADPFNVFVQGVCKTFNSATTLQISHGNMHRILCIIIILILLLVDKMYIKIGTLLCMLFGGPIIDVYSALLCKIINNNSSLYVRVICLCIGCIILAYGMTLVIKSNAGTGPNDLVAVVISEKAKIKFGIVRIAVDISFVVCGLLMGGVFGVGTVICCFLVGPVADFFMPINEKVIEQIIVKYRKENEYNG